MLNSGRKSKQELKTNRKPNMEPNHCKTDTGSVAGRCTQSLSLKRSFSSVPDFVPTPQKYFGGFFGETI